MSGKGSDKSAAELLGVLEVPKRGRDRIVATAVELFYRHGFAAVGLDRVLAEAGVSKTTFYKHFESKDELMVAAVEMRDRWERAAWERAARLLAGGDPKKQLLAMFDVMDAWFNDPQFGGCLFINAAAEFPHPHDPVHRAAAAHKRANRQAIRDLAEAAGVRDPEHFADRYTLIFEGALVMRQVFDRDDAAQLGRIAAEQLLREEAGDDQ
jgi:AcrR family transcriptional regulator